MAGVMMSKKNGAIFRLLFLILGWSLSHCLSGDETTLKQVRMGLNWLGGDGELPCQWAGVTCNGEGLVTDLRLRNYGLSGQLPAELGNLKSLISLDLSQNDLSGSIPAELANLLNLQFLDLSQNSLTGLVPPTFANMIRLHTFSAYENALFGGIPFGPSNPFLRSLNLANNRLNESIPESICASGKLETLILSRNFLHGNIPPALGSCIPLINLRLSANLLSGAIPPEIGYLTNLQYFEADRNSLTGAIPIHISKCVNLSLLNLANNQLSGDIPTLLGNLQNLQELHLSSNSLSGEIPTDFSRCKDLNSLDLSHNRLSGAIPPELCQAPKLQFLLLQGNALSGPISRDMGDCTQLLDLQLSNNSLNGSIPRQFGRLLSLEYSLNLSWNGLDGVIPGELGSLGRLTSLDLSHNQLSGNIPSSFRNLSSLINVDLSNNNLSGRIPQIGSYGTNVSSNTFLNNLGLCGSPLPPCPDDANLGQLSHSRRKNTLFWIPVALVALCSVIALSIWISVGTGVVKSCQFSSSCTPDPKIRPPIVAHVLVETYRNAIDFSHLQDASSLINTANLIASNHLSSIYKVVTRSGHVLAVKKIHLVEIGCIIPEAKMVAEVERAAGILHENVMSPIGYLLQKEDEDASSLLVYDFVPLCSLHQGLHGNSEVAMDWLTRYRIALGTAQGLCFLHHSCHPSLVHLDITSSSLLFSANLEVKIGDLEITNMFDTSKHARSIGSIAGSFGYMAPEYAFTMKVTTACNIYSFGVVLLELLTGHLPTEDCFGEGLDLVRWVHGAPSRGDTPEQILDSRISALSFSTRQHMLAVLKIAIMCTDLSASRRPHMKEVVEMLVESCP